MCENIFNHVVFNSILTENVSCADKQEMSQMSKTTRLSAEKKQKSSTELNPQLNTQSKPGTSLIYKALIDKKITEKKEFGDKT